MSGFAPAGRHKLTIELEDYFDFPWDSATMTCDVDLDNDLVYDWSAEGKGGEDLSHLLDAGDVYDLAWRHLERRWKAEQKLVALIVGE